MNLTSYEHATVVLVEGEGLPATRHFAAGHGGVITISATPLGVVVRRSRDEQSVRAGNPQYADLLLRDGGGWGILDKQASVPAGLAAPKKGQGR